jgi:hypothetical protein
MPLTPVQRSVAAILCAFRDEHNYVAGGAALNQAWPRLSDDLDIFLDWRSRLPNQVESELEALREAGFAVEITTENDLIVEALVRKYEFETRVQWMDDPETCRRFFPATFDDELGFRLHQADVAVNKVLCASRRREARDAVDVANIVRRYAPLGPLVWAATGKSTDESPLRMVSDIRDNAFGFSDEQISTVRMVDGSRMTRAEMRRVVGPALDSAATYCEEIAPIDYIGCLFVDDSECPIMAEDDTIADGSANVVRLRDFTPAPTIDPT